MLVLIRPRRQKKVTAAKVTFAQKIYLGSICRVVTRYLAPKEKKLQFCKDPVHTNWRDFQLL